MLNSIISGLFRGFFAKPIEKWLLRYKLRTIFFISILSIHLIAFLQDGWVTGWSKALHKSIAFITTPTGFLVPIGLSFLVVIIFAINSPVREKEEAVKAGDTNQTNTNDQNKHNHKDSK